MSKIKFNKIILLVTKHYFNFLRIQILTFIKTYVSLKPYIEIRKKEEGFEIAQSFKSIAKKWNDDYKLSYEI